MVHGDMESSAIRHVIDILLVSTNVLIYVCIYAISRWDPYVSIYIRIYAAPSQQMRYVVWLSRSRAIT